MSLDQLSPLETTVLTFGITTILLLGTTFYYIKQRKNSSDNSGGVVEESVKELDLLKYPGGHLTIYYGSQTGTAQMFAKQLSNEASTHGFYVERIVDLQDVIDNEDEVSLQLAHRECHNEEGKEEIMDDDAILIRATLTHKHYRDTTNNNKSKAIFLMATYGEGEPTDNAQQFVNIMKGKSGITNIYKVNDGDLNAADSTVSLDEATLSYNNNNSVNDTNNNNSERDKTFLNDFEYAVFGLGNKQYEHYNNMSKFVDLSLNKCGAQRIVKLGLGDDDDDLEGDFENWKDNVLWPSLVKKYVKSPIVKSSTNGVNGGAATSLPSCPYSVEYVDSSSLTEEEKKEDISSNIQTSSKHYSQAVDCPVVSTRELRSSSDPGSTIHMEIDISNHMNVMKYTTADNLGILPKNDSLVVEAVANALGYNLDRMFHLVPNKEVDDKKQHTLPFPTPCTVRECLERYCDLTGPPRRSDLKQIAPYAQNDIDRKALLRMSSKEGKAEYKEKIVESHIGIADIVTRLCTSIAMPLEHFIMICPRLQPRYYTISSSSNVYPKTIHITLAVLEDTKKNGEVFKGVCSSHLAGLKCGDMVRAFVRESTFRLPKQVERPVLMFGPGTGIAPMRAILQDISHGRKMGVEHGSSILYFGCKDRKLDYIYRDELESFQNDGTLAELHLAFSREQAQKVYVQHLLAKKGKETWRLIHDEKGSIFVCGAVKMGADVDHTLQDIISEHGGMSREKAKAYLDKMAVSGRFVQELWS